MLTLSSAQDSTVLSSSSSSSLQSLEKINKRRDLQQQLTEAKLQQADALLADAQEKHKREKEYVSLAAQELSTCVRDVSLAPPTHGQRKGCHGAVDHAGHMSAHDRTSSGKRRRFVSAAVKQSVRYVFPSSFAL